jgi:hypothetical protein
MAGHAITVLDEHNLPVKDARVWLGGTDYPVDEHGEATIPFASAEKRVEILLCQGDFAFPAQLHHLAELYQLSAQFYLQREATIRGNHAAQVVVRPCLTVAGAATSLKLLKKTRLSIGKKVLGE